MTARPLTPIVPASAVPSGRQLAKVAGRRPLPLARPVPAPPTPEDVVYGIGRIDSSGRIADRAVTTALGWRAGDRLTLTADAGVVTARRDPGGIRDAVIGGGRGVALRFPLLTLALSEGQTFDSLIKEAFPV